MSTLRCVLLASAAATSVWAFAPLTIPSRSSATQLNAAALIVQNKGGGHGELGYQLAKILQSNYSDKIDSITILQDDACKMNDQEPFKSYATDLPDVTVIQAPLSDESLTQSDLQSILGGDSVKFEYVWDNNSKKPEGAAKACADCAQAWGVKLYVYVSSAGIYTPAADGPFPMAEATTPVKESAGQVAFDKYCGDEQKLPLVSFRPQYIYGPKANKFDYIDYFFDRLVRGLPIPIPGDGTQKVSLTHSEDVAALLASPLNNEPAAVAQRFFNCGTDLLVSYDEVAQLCAKVAGIKDFDVEHFDAELYGKGAFPFRPTNFYVAPDMAKEKLGWEGAKHKLEDDLVAYYANYVERGGPEKKLSFIKDWEIVVGSKTSPPEYLASIYDEYDPLVLDMTSAAQEQ